MSQKHTDFISLAICKGLKTNGKSTWHNMFWIYWSFFFPYDLWKMEAEEWWRQLNQKPSRALHEYIAHATWLDSSKNSQSENSHSENLVVFLVFDPIILLKELSKQIFIWIYCLRIGDRAVRNPFLFKKCDVWEKARHWAIWIKE